MTRGTGAPDPVDEGHHVPVPGMERDHEVVVADPGRLPQHGARAVPRVLVVQHHRPADQRLQLGDALVGVKDLLGAENRVVRVVIGYHERQRVGLIQELSDRWLDRRQLGGMVQLVAEQVEQQAEHLVLGVGVPRCGQLTEGALNRGHLTLAVFPRGQYRQENIVATLRHVAPARRPLLEHRDRVPVGPEQILAQIAQQLKAPRVGPGLNAGQDVGPGRCLSLEIPLDHGAELLERPQDREVQLTEEIRREHQTTVPVDHKRFHTSPPSRTSPDPPATCLPGLAA